jgi:hypothetical protein
MVHQEHLEPQASKEHQDNKDLKDQMVNQDQLEMQGNLVV